MLIINKNTIIKKIMLLHRYNFAYFLTLIRRSFLKEHVALKTGVMASNFKTVIYIVIIFHNITIFHKH